MARDIFLGTASSQVSPIREDVSISVDYATETTTPTRADVVPNFQWYYGQNSGSLNPITSGIATALGMSGYLTNTLTFPASGAVMSGAATWYFYLTASLDGAETQQTNTCSLQVIPATAVLTPSGVTLEWDGGSYPEQVFSVSTNWTQNLTYTWYVDGQINDGTLTTDGANATLTAQGSDRSNTSMAIYCTISNPYYSITSNTATVTFGNIDSGFEVDDLADVSIIYANSFGLDTVVTGGSGSFSYVWQLSSTRDFSNPDEITDINDDSSDMIASLLDASDYTTANIKFGPNGYAANLPQPLAFYYRVGVTDTLTGTTIYSNGAAVNLTEGSATMTPLYTELEYNDGGFPALEIKINTTMEAPTTYSWAYKVHTESSYITIDPSNFPIGTIDNDTLTLNVTDSSYIGRDLDWICQCANIWSGTTPPEPARTLFVDSQHDFTIGELLNYNEPWSTTYDIPITVTGGTGSYTYDWEIGQYETGPWQSVDGSEEYLGVTGNDTNTLTILGSGGLGNFGSTFYLRVVVSDGSGELTSNVAAISGYNPPIKLAPDHTNLEYADGAFPSLDMTFDTVMETITSCIFYKSTDGVNYVSASDIVSYPGDNARYATLASQTDSSLIGTKLYFICIAVYANILGSMMTETSNSIVVDFVNESQIVVTQQPPSTVNVIVGSTGTIDCAFGGGSGDYSYEWFVGNTATTIDTSFATFPWGTTTSAQYGTVNDVINTESAYTVYLQCAGTDNQSNDVVRTNVTEFTVYKELSFLTEPVSVTMALLSSANFSVYATGGLGTLKYQWQRLVSGVWNNLVDTTTGSLRVTGATTAALTLTRISLISTDSIRCVVYDDISSITSTVAYFVTVL